LSALVIVGGWPTVNEKLCVALLPTPLLAVKVIGKLPLTVGVPLSRPVPGVNVTPAGSGPLWLNVGTGKPVAVTANDPAVFTTMDVLFALVIAGAWLTVRLKLCVAFGSSPLEAVMVTGYAPPVLGPGIPLSTPVVVLNVTPLGKAPVALNVGAGNPVAVTVNEPEAPTMNVVLFALVIDGAWFTVCDNAEDVLVVKLLSPP
jgi:hypothetical protein